MSDNPIAFMAKNLVVHRARLDTLSALMKVEMHMRVDAGDSHINIGSCRGSEEYNHLTGIIDRLERDIARDLSKNPTLLVECCKYIAEVQLVERLMAPVLRPVDLTANSIWDESCIPGTTFPIDEKSEGAPNNSDPRRDPGAA